MKLNAWRFLLKDQCKSLDILCAVLYMCQTYLQNKGRERGYCLDKDKKLLIINFVNLFEK